MSPEDVARFPISVDGRLVGLGELFEIEIQPSEASQLLFVGDLSAFVGLAAGHDQGEFSVEGDAGDFLAASMSGGRVSVTGNVGNFVAAPLAARRAGMSGGSVMIHGDAGDYLGHRMRRGTIVVHGNCGDFLAASMIAGTIAVKRCFGGEVAVNMRRGTLLLPSGAGASLQNGMRYSAPYPFESAFVNLFPPDVREPLDCEDSPARMHRIRCDRTVDGLGEILLPANSIEC
jgi:formylmethanofuran dehydrogenase subunit C